MRASEKTQQPRVTDPLWGEPPVTSGFHSQKASKAEMISCHGVIDGTYAAYRELVVGRISWYFLTTENSVVAGPFVNK